MKPNKTPQENCVIYDFHQALVKRENGILPIEYFDNPTRIRRMVLEVRYQRWFRKNSSLFSALRWLVCEKCKHCWATPRRRPGVREAFVECPNCGFDVSTKRPKFRVNDEA